MADVPPPEDAGGWPFLLGTDEIRAQAGMELSKLESALRAEAERSIEHSYGLLVVRHGLLVAEIYARNVGNRKRFDLWSCTKSFTSLAWGLAIADGAASLDTPIYSLIPDAHGLSDPRKELITVGHVLSMTSGIAGDTRGLAGMPTRADYGIFEFALGHAPNRYEQWVGRLVDKPGAFWDYSDPAFAHLSLAFPTATGGYEIADVMAERVFAPLGVDAVWDLQGGSGYRGPHTNAHTGLAMSGRDLARIGLLLLRGGGWEERQVMPRAWIETATHPTQTLNRSYGYGFWTNAEDEMTPGLPRDAFMLAGFHENRCYVVPSADLVLVRVGTGSRDWDESRLLRGVLEAIV